MRERWREQREKREQNIPERQRDREREWERGNDNMKNQIEIRIRIKNTCELNLIKIHEYYENLKSSKSEAF